MDGTGRDAVRRLLVAYEGEIQRAHAHANDRYKLWQIIGLIAGLAVGVAIWASASVGAVAIVNCALVGYLCGMIVGYFKAKSINVAARVVTEDLVRALERLE